MTSIAQLLPLARTERVNVAVIGDSVTEGQGASAFTTRYIARLNAAVRQRFQGAAGSGGGLGLIPIHGTGETSFTWPISHTALSTTALGPVRFCSQTAGTTSWTWTAPSGTSTVQVMYFDADPGSVAGSWSWQVGSGAVTTVANAGAGDGTLTAPITISGGQVLTLRWVSGFTFLDGLVHFAGDESSGVTFHGCGHSGWTAAATSGGWTQGSSFDWRPSIANLIPGPGAVAICLGLNDANLGIGAESAAAYQSNMETLISYLHGNSKLASLPLLIVIPYLENQTLVEPWSGYVTAAKAVAASAGAQWIDLGTGIGPVADDTEGLFADAVHPDDAGHQVVADLIAKGIMPASGALLLAARA